MNNKSEISSSDIEQHWIKTEFAGIEFGDRRLNMRFQKTAEILSEQPLSSINQACHNWAETKGAYRLFGNDKVEPKEILLPHQLKTKLRIQEQSRILVIQDTSFINYTTHPSVSGLGSIGNVNKKKETKLDTLGLVMHTALAVSTEGLSLGILDQEIWARDEKKASRKQKVSRQRVPVEEKESYKWLRALMRTVDLLPAEVQAVTVCDRESDMYEFIGKAEALKTQYLIRSSWNRSIQVEHEDYYLWDYVSDLPCMGTVEIEVEPKRVRKQKLEQNRIAKLEVRFARVELRRNEKKKVNRKECPRSLSSYVVLVTC